MFPKIAEIFLPWGGEFSLTLKDKRTIVRAFARQYQKGLKREKSLLLKRLVKSTGYHRKYLGRILKCPSKQRRIKRSRISRYFPVLKPLKKLWAVSNYACGKRLVPMIPVYLSSLGRFHELPKMTAGEKQLLKQISPATADRLLSRD